MSVTMRSARLVHSNAVLRPNLTGELAFYPLLFLSDICQLFNRNVLDERLICLLYE